MKMNRMRFVTYMVTLLILCMVILGGCGKTEQPSSNSGKEKKSQKASTKTVTSLQEMNELPEDGIITKEELETVAGEDMQIAFHGSDASGIEYVWTFDCSQIQNPMDQNLKIDFQLEDLEEIKEKANHAKDAIVMTMHGKGLVCVPSLKVTLPDLWESDTVLLLKEQDGKLARMSEVTIENETTTSLTMNVTSLDGDCYLVGGITKVESTTEIAEDKEEEDSDSDSAGEDNGDSEKADSGSKSSSNSSGKDVANDVSKDDSLYCTISISCKTILDNLDNLKDGKEEFVPSNGWILEASKVEFTEGESVYDILQRVCKEAGIHMESSSTPAYGSAYIEGINQLYEFDCGELSGWMFSVNDWFPNYGCSKYYVKDGDVIKWVYTCDLGKDVGDNSMY